MLGIRVIPTLLLRNTGLVKGVKFRDHRYVGDPVNAVKIFNVKEVDELVFLDITATIESREPNYELLEDIASQAFLPFGYGGGINSVYAVENILKLGVEKVIINSAAAKDLSLIREASKIAGSQSVVISIDVKRSILGQYYVFTRSGSFNTKMNPIDYAHRVEEAGAGEILLCSIDREGTGKGYDEELIRNIAMTVGIPVVAAGGAGALIDFRKAVLCGASAVAAGDMFTFYGRRKAVLITYPEYHILEDVFRKEL